MPATKVVLHEEVTLLALRAEPCNQLGFPHNNIETLRFSMAIVMRWGDGEREHGQGLTVFVRPTLRTGAKGGPQKVHVRKSDNTTILLLLDR